MLDEIDKIGADYRGRPVRGAARGPRPRAELLLPRPLPGRHLRPVEGALHRDGERDRPDPPRVPRPHGGHSPVGLHRGGEGDRPPPPDPEAGATRTASPRPTSVHRRRVERMIEALHARGRACATSSARSARSAGRSRSRRRRARRAGTVIGDARRSRRCWGRSASCPRSGWQEDRVGVATGLAWTPVGGDILYVEAIAVRGKGDLRLTGSAGRGHEGVGAGRLSYVRARAAAARHPGRLLRDPRRSRPRSRRARLPRTGPRPGSRCSAMISCFTQPASRAARPGHDGRDHAAGRGAPGRRRSRRRCSPPGRRRSRPSSCRS